MVKPGLSRAVRSRGKHQSGVGFAAERKLRPGRGHGASPRPHSEPAEQARFEPGLPGTGVAAYPPETVPQP